MFDDIYVNLHGRVCNPQFFYINLINERTLFTIVYRGSKSLLPFLFTGSMYIYLIYSKQKSNNNTLLYIQVKLQYATLIQTYFSLTL